MPDLPIVGKVPKGWVIAVGGISAVVIGYAWYRHKQQAQSSTDTSATDTSFDPNAIDPATGLTYAEEQAYGAGGFGFPGATGGSGGTGDTGGVPGPGSFTSNAQWATYAESQLAGIVDATALSAALGVYLTGRPASTDQISLIDQAIAIAGYPPVAGPGNNPPGIVPGGGGGGGNAQNPVTGLHVTQSGFTGVDIAWHASTGATGYTVTTDKGVAELTGSTSARIHNIAPQHSQATVRVLATPAASGAQPAKIVVHVK